jgi:hypothetical protein
MSSPLIGTQKGSRCQEGIRTWPGDYARRRPVKDLVAPGRFLLIAGDGAIVVRPDRFIAWRSPAAASDPRAVLTAALSQTLGRRPFAQPGSAGS